MAETKKNTTASASPERVTVRLPRANGKNAEQAELFSVNGTNYRIKRGETVEIPKEVAEVIENGEKAEEYAMRYMDNLKETVAAKDRELGINS